MPRYPGAAWRPISKSRRFLVRPLIVCIHTMVGSLRGTDAHFRRVGTDSHFGLGNPTDGDLDGAVWQWVDTSRVAFANYLGNDDVISIETSDGANPNNPWSPKALDSLVNLVVWLCRTHNVRSILINGNTPGSAGLAYHRQGCDHSSSYRPKGWAYDQWRVRHGVRWSTAIGKVCPGDVRIRQWVDVVLPRVRAALSGTERTWFDMASEEDLRRIVREELRDNQAFRGRGLDYVNDNPTTKDHQLARVHQYTFERDRPWKARMENPVNGSSWYMQTFLRNAYAHALAARDEARAVKAAVAANGAALEAIAKALAEHDGNADPEAFAAAVRESAEAGAKAALESMPLAAVLVREDGPDPDESTPDEEQS